MSQTKTSPYGSFWSDGHKRRAWLRRRIRSASIARLGPGLITGAADDDPSGIATYSQGGAAFGFGLLWTLVLTYPLMSAIQLIAAHIGRVTGGGLAKNMGHVMPRWVVTTLVSLLFVANTINIGADLAAMGAAMKLVAGGSAHVFTIAFALLSLLLQLFIPYNRYAQFLKWLTLSLFAYVGVVLIVKLDWSRVLLGLVLPDVDFSADTITTIVALFGTTISPYLFFWQSAQEVEEISSDALAKPLLEAPRQATRELARIRFDTYAGMAFSNLIALAIMISAAATLYSTGKTGIQTAADAAAALEPVAGKFAFLLFGIGIVGTGLLAVPVLAGSAAYAVGETRGWKTGLDHMPWQAVGFYSIIGAAVLIGLGIEWSPINPIQALFWSAVINGIVAVPMMVAMMLVVTNPKQMGKFTAGRSMRFFGWAGTVIMALTAVVMVISFFV